MTNAIRLVQIQHPAEGRRVAVVDGDRLLLLIGHHSVYACAVHALLNEESLASLIARVTSDVALDYDAIYAGTSEWHLLPAFDHPIEPARCLVSGTGLTHRKSADNRNAMHQKAGDTSVAAPQTDSMKIYAWGEAGGRPEAGTIGVQPEWFYKGNGTILRAHGEALTLPAHGEDGGEEAEIAAAYVIDTEGLPWRVGFMQGNEFSDHKMEARNYLYLAPSKLRVCSLGPEIVIATTNASEHPTVTGADDAIFGDVQGVTEVQRAGQPLWRQEIASGESNMVHTLANLEHHHFKYPAHRHPGDAHVHFFGTGGFSFGSGITLEEGDEMVVTFANYGRPLRNPLDVEAGPPTLAAVKQL